MDLSKNKASIYSSLGTLKMRRKHGIFSVEGEKSVMDTFSYFDVEAIIYRKGYELPEELRKFTTYSVSDDLLNRISNLSTPSNLIAIYKLPASEHHIPNNINKRLFVVLDGIQDPGNLGTIIRTCHWFGLFDIFASFNTVDVYNPKTIQATMGSLAHVRVHYCDLTSLLAAHPDMPVYGMVIDGESIYNAKLEKRGFIVMGNEGKGISTELRKHINTGLTIPPGSDNHSESLNVAIATAITISWFSAI